MLLRYWTVDPTVVADTKHEVNSDVERIGNRNRALEAMEEERQVCALSIACFVVGVR